MTTASNRGDSWVMSRAHMLFVETLGDVPYWQIHDAWSLALSDHLLPPDISSLLLFIVLKVYKASGRVVTLTNHFGICSSRYILIICHNFALDIRPHNFLNKSVFNTITHMHLTTDRVKKPFI